MVRFDRKCVDMVCKRRKKKAREREREMWQKRKIENGEKRKKDIDIKENFIYFIILI